MCVWWRRRQFFNVFAISPEKLTTNNFKTRILTRSSSDVCDDVKITNFTNTKSVVKRIRHKDLLDIKILRGICLFNQKHFARFAAKFSIKIYFDTFYFMILCLYACVCVCTWIWCAFFLLTAICFVFTSFV